MMTSGNITIRDWLRAIIRNERKVERHKTKLMGDIGVAEVFSREGLFFWFLIEISTAFGTYSLWDNSVWHQLTVGNVACILLWAVQNMLLLSLVKNYSLQFHHRYPSETLEIDPHPVRFSNVYLWKKKHLVINLI